MLKDFQSCKNSSFVTPFKLILDFGDSKSAATLPETEKQNKSNAASSLTYKKEKPDQSSHKFNSYSDFNTSSFKNSNLLSKMDDNSYDKPKKQGFKLSNMIDQVQEQNKIDKEQQSQINKKMFYSHFDDSYKDIMEYITTEMNENQSTSQQKNLQAKPKFKKVENIRPEIIFNIKQMIRMQRLRAEKIYKEEIKPDEMIDYMRKRNQIEIILENSKQIKNLKGVADLIEKEIEIQNKKINDLVQKLIVKFGLEQYQIESELEKQNLSSNK
ncbi:hypothetical protein ABPG72_010159 [Tetrahymena utriculariae]